MKDIIFLPVFEAWLILCRIWNLVWLSWRLMLPALFPACGTCSCSHRALLQRVHSRVRYCPNRSAYTSDCPRSNHCTEWGQWWQSGCTAVCSALTVSSLSGSPSRWQPELKDKSSTVITQGLYIWERDHQKQAELTSNRTYLATSLSIYQHIQWTWTAWFSVSSPSTCLCQRKHLKTGIDSDLLPHSLKDTPHI